MIAFSKEQLAEYPQLQDAITLCELGGLKFRSIYIDPDGEIAITFDRLLTEERVKFVLMHLLDIIYGDCNVSAIKPKQDVDFVYNFAGRCTQIFTPDGLDFRPHFHHTPMWVQI